MVRFHRFGGNDVLKIEKLETSQPDAGQVLVSVHAASINPIDFKIRSGLYPGVRDDRLPYTPGRDISGVVAACGAQSTRFKVGDEVFGIVDIHGGGYSQQIAVINAPFRRSPPGSTMFTRPPSRLQGRLLGRACSVMAVLKQDSRC